MAGKVNPEINKIIKQEKEKFEDGDDGKYQGIKE